MPTFTVTLRRTVTQETKHEVYIPLESSSKDEYESALLEAEQAAIDEAGNLTWETVEHDDPEVEDTTCESWHG